MFGKLVIKPVVRSENLQPIAIRQSHSSTIKLETLRPCIPNIPRDNGLSSGNEPFPISVVVTGAPIISEKFKSSFEESDNTTPPPAKITGFLRI